MNHLKARQRESDGRWDYTSRNDHRVHAVGYCAGHHEWTTDDVVVHSQEHADQMNAKEEPFRELYHTDGHATEAEACACYRRYLLDHARFHRWDHEDVLPGVLHICDEPECTEYTAHTAAVGYGVPETYHLCDKHLNRDTLEALYPEVGESWTS